MYRYPASPLPRSPTGVPRFINGVNDYTSPMKGNALTVTTRNSPPAPPIGRPPASPGNRSLPPPPLQQPNFGYRGGQRY